MDQVRRVSGGGAKLADVVIVGCRSAVGTHKDAFINKVASKYKNIGGLEKEDGPETKR